MNSGNQKSPSSGRSKRKPPVLKDNSPEDEARILAAAGGDPDALPRTEEQLQAMKRGRGRPRGVSKTHVGIGLDHDVAAFYRGLGKGHQALMNYILRKAMEEAQHRQSTLNAIRE